MCEYVIHKLKKRICAAMYLSMSNFFLFSSFPFFFPLLPQKFETVLRDKFHAKFMYFLSISNVQLGHLSL